MRNSLLKFVKSIALMQVGAMVLLCFMASCAQNSKTEKAPKAETKVEVTDMK